MTARPSASCRCHMLHIIQPFTNCLSAVSLCGKPLPFNFLLCSHLRHHIISNYVLGVCYIIQMPRLSLSPPSALPILPVLPSLMCIYRCNVPAKHTSQCASDRALFCNICKSVRALFCAYVQPIRLISSSGFLRALRLLRMLLICK